MPTLSPPQPAPARSPTMHRITSAARGLLLAPVLTAAALTAQGQNVQLLAHVDRFPGGTASSNNYAGIYGAVIQGRELAIVTARTGTLIYDCIPFPIPTISKPFF